MSTHTPGPWEVSTDPDGNGTYKIREHVDAELEIERQADQETDEAKADSLYAKQNELREANARLIAAAPDLLIALEAMVDAPDDDSRYNAAIDARAAIAKAKGGGA